MTTQTEQTAQEITGRDEIKLSDLLDKVHNFVTTAKTWLTRSMRDDDYYHHIQWTKKDKQKLEERGQQASVDNRIAPKVNYTAGIRSRYKMQTKALPRTPLHSRDSHVFDDVVSALADRTNYFDLEADAGEDLGRVGYGGYVFGTRVVPDATPPDVGVAIGAGTATVEAVGDVRERVEITLTGVMWSEFMWDARSRRADFSDATWMAIVKWRDYEDVLNDPQYAEARGVLEQTRTDSGNDIASDDPFAKDKTSWFAANRNEIQVAEMYVRRPAQNHRGWNWWVAHLTGSGWLLRPTEVTYHVEDDDAVNWCPLLMGSAYCNRHGERYGLVRGLVSLQDSVNQRESRLLYEISGQGFWYEESAVESALETKQELLKANPAVKLNDGAMSDPESGPSFGIIDRGQNADGQRYLLESARASIDRMGPTPNPQGQGSTLVTTPMAEMMQDGGILELGPYMRRQKSLRRQAVERMWWMARQFWVREDYLRVLDERAADGYRFLPVNRRMTAGERVREQISAGVAAPDAVAGAMGADGARKMAELVMRAGQEAAALAQQATVPGQPPQPQDPQQTQQRILARALDLLMQDPLAAKPFVLNDISKVSVDFTLEDLPFHPTSAHEELIEIIRLGKETMQPIPLKLVIKESNLRNKEEWIAELEKGPSPQQQQMQLQQIQLQMQQQQATIQALQAQSQKWQAEGNAAGARAARDVAAAALNQAQTERVGSEIDENRAQAAHNLAKADAAATGGE